MNCLLEKGYLTEIMCGTNFSYVVSDNSCFSALEYKVLQNQTSGCFVKSMKMLYNGELQFFYLTKGYKPLSKIISLVDEESFKSIIINLFSSILMIKSNGFLTCCSVDISFDKIFVDPLTYKVALVYVPITERMYADEETVENYLKTDLIRFLSANISDLSLSLRQFKEDLADGTLSLKDLCDRIRNCSSSISKNKTMHMISTDFTHPIDIEITKKEFIIGRNPAAVDGVVSFNINIGRVHCQIFEENGNYMIMDLDTRNGTYIRNTRLIPRKTYPIHDGDVIRLADSLFQLKLL